MKITFGTLFMILFLMLLPVSEARSELNIDVQLGSPYYYAPPPPVVHYYREEPVVVYRRPPHRPRPYYYEAYDYRYRPRHDPHYRHYRDRYHD